MKRMLLTRFSLAHPWWVLALTLMATLFLGSQFPKVHFDNDPENMLAPDEPVRLFHHRVKETFDLYDFVIVGIVNETHPDGIFNVDTLGRIDRLTRELSSLHRDPDGRPAVTSPAHASQAERTWTPDLQPTSKMRQVLATAFSHDPEDLFTEEGESVIIAREIISPSVVDNIKQAERGQLRIEYLMERPPQTEAEALTIRDDAMGNPLYKGTLVSEDGKAICLYLPIVAKPYSYNVAHLVEVLTEDWGSEDKVYITGLPVAEDTFGVEMLIQMATSAPLAGLAIFVLLYLFFRRLSLIVAPMLVAMITVVCTMGLLIGLGYDVHIMSSMIAIFLMPIAVADSVHVLSEFYDTYARFRDKAATARHVIRHLFMPMLYTSLTTMAGFASLGLTPIPPVRVFGLHIAFGVGLAWLLTITLVPAYIMLCVSDASLAKAVANRGTGEKHESWLQRFLERLGAFTYTRWKLVIVLALLLAGAAAYGMSLIQVNDNPVKWFTPEHRIRVADRVLNDHFGGTYTAYLTLQPRDANTLTCAEQADAIRERVSKDFGERAPDTLAAFLHVLDEQAGHDENGSDRKACFERLVEAAASIDEAAARSWNELADAVNYLEPDALTPETLATAIRGVEGVEESARATLLTRIGELGDLNGTALQDRTLAICDEYTTLSLREFLFALDAEFNAPAFKQPELLRYVERLQNHLTALPRVGKTSSAVDALKKASYELNYVASDAGTDQAEQNASFFSVPDTPSAVAQVYTQLEGMKKRDSLFHLVTRDYGEANVWVQLTRGDNSDMEGVVAETARFMKENPPPQALDAGWAGLTYINVVWQDKMVRGMLAALGSSFVVVLIMMTVLFRSPLFGLLSMLPLSLTIAFVYGLIGLAGKDYDMPVAVLSALTLGLSIDFAIHFLQRARVVRQRVGHWRGAVGEMFREPAMAISRNAIIISVGFTPLLLAPLVPYKTVGFFLATIMAVSWIGTLLLLSALVTMLERVLFKDQNTKGEDS